jgi:hypothetical protein
MPEELPVTSAILPFWLGIQVKGSAVIYFRAIAAPLSYQKHEGKCARQWI